MNRREVAEIRRRFRPERSNIGSVRGCLINENREIVTTFRQQLGELQPLLTEQVMPVIRRTLSGTLGRQLVDISFSTRQVSESEEHKCLERLRRSGLADEEALAAFYDRVRNSLNLESNYLILLTAESYDVPAYGKGGDKEESTEVYTYMLCSICPVKIADTPSLGFVAHESLLRCFTVDPCVAKPELGFLFPAFDNRATNIYGALYYSRSVSDNHPDFCQGVFGVTPPAPVSAQRASFCEVLSEEKVAEGCSYEVVEGMREQIGGIIEAHKAEKIPETLYVTGAMLHDMLCSSGLSEEQGAAFVQSYDSTFGAGAEFCPANLIDPSKLVLETPDATVRVSSDRGDLVETRLVDGVPCIVVRIEGEVTLNGVPLAIPEDKV